MAIRIGGVAIRTGGVAIRTGGVAIRTGGVGIRIGGVGVRRFDWRSGNSDSLSLVAKRAANLVGQFDLFLRDPAGKQRRIQPGEDFVERQHHWLVVVLAAGIDKHARSGQSAIPQK